MPTALPMNVRRQVTSEIELVRQFHSLIDVQDTGTAIQNLYLLIRNRLTNPRSIPRFSLLFSRPDQSDGFARIIGNTGRPSGLLRIKASQDNRGYIKRVYVAVLGKKFALSYPHLANYGKTLRFLIGILTELEEVPKLR